MDKNKKNRLEEKLLFLSPSPHQKSGESVPKIMWTVVITLIPASAMGVYFFGLRALWVMLVSILATVTTEAIIQLLRKQRVTVYDGSAVITGLLLALVLPPAIPFYAVIIGGIFAIGIGKQVFGGLGYNIFNPALIGRAFLQASFPVKMTTWTPTILQQKSWMNAHKVSQATSNAVDAITAATPLGSFKFEKTLTPYIDLLWGNVGGCIGETSAIAIIIGGLVILFLKYADWRIPVSYLGTVAVFGGLFWLINPQQYPDPLFHLLSGGLMLGAFFMATDMVTSPITPLGSWIFGIGAGVILIIIRLFGGLPEGVMYSILLMNSVTPLINRYTRPRIFGERK